jgi:hypothetical protein
MTTANALLSKGYFPHELDTEPMGMLGHADWTVPGPYDGSIEIRFRWELWGKMIS